MLIVVYNLLVTQQSTLYGFPFNMLQIRSLLLFLKLFKQYVFFRL